MYSEPVVELDPAPNYWKIDDVLAHLQETNEKYKLHPNLQPEKIYHINPTIASLPVSKMGMGDQQQCPEILHQPGVIHQLSTYDNTGTKGIARTLNHRRIHPLSIPTVRVHVDGGANRSITNDSGHLLSYRNIKKYPMAGVAAGEAALMCTGVGYLP